MLKNPRQILKDISLDESLSLVQKVVASDEILHFKSRYENLEREKRLGLSMPERYTIERNQIQWSWIEQINQLTDEEIEQIIRQSYLTIEPEALFSKFRLASILLNEWKL